MTNNMTLKYTVTDDNRYFTINDVLSKEFKLSARLTSKLIKAKNIYLNGKSADTRNHITTDDIITINLNNEEDNSNIVPTKMDLKIIYEDEWLLVLNKPAGIAIHPSLLHYEDSLSNGVKYYFDSIHLHKKIRPVNRLDFNTSGLVVFAKCEYVQEMLSKQMANQTFEKEYLCVIEDTLENKTGTINLPIARKPGSIIERCIDEQNGQPSITHYTVLEEFDILSETAKKIFSELALIKSNENPTKKFSLIKCKLETGRTHQIRVHLAAIGHPLLGDTLYGKESPLISRQALHSCHIAFTHPVTKEKLDFVSYFIN